MKFDFKDTSPFSGMVEGYWNGKKARQQYNAQNLANSIQAVKAKNAQPMADAALRKEQLYNDYYAPNIQSEMDLRKAQAGASTAGAMKNQMLVKYLNGGGNLDEPITASGTPAQRPIAQQPIPGQQQAAAHMSGRQVVDHYTAQHPTEGQAQARGPDNVEQQEPQEQQPAIGANQAPQQQASQSRSMWGIETPQPTKRDLINQMLGNDTFSSRQKMAQEQQQAQQKSFTDAIAQASETAQAATQTNQVLDKFNGAMDMANHKGHLWGARPSSGITTVLPHTGDFSADQIADKAVSEMMPGAMHQIKDAMGSGQFSNLDSKYAAQLKFDRTMDDDTRHTQTAWVKATNARSNEKPAFYAKLSSDPTNAPQKIQADLAWQSYQNAFPLIDAEGKNVQTQNLKKWPIFTTPKAIESIKRTGSYKPTQAEKDAHWLINPDTNEIVPIPPRNVSEALRSGFREA